MANWRDLTARASRTANKLFGEPVCLSFFKAGQIDAERPMLERLQAELHLPAEGEGKLARSSSSFSTQIVSGVGLLIIQKADFGSGRLLTGDKVRALDRDGRPWFEILSVDSKGADRIVAQISLTTKAANLQQGE